jgi:hypothetical protein
MKLRNLLIMLVAMVFSFAIGCKEQAEKAEQADAGIKARGEAVEKAESEEAEGTEEGGEEAAEQQMKQVKGELPAAVAKAIEDNVPGAEIEILTVEKEAGIVLYDIEFKAGRGEIEVAEDGMVMDISSIITMEDLPKAAAEVIEEATEGGTIKQIEKSEVRAEIKKEGERGTIVRITAPKYVYEAEFTKGGRMAEIQVAPDGTVVEATKWTQEGIEEEEEKGEKEEAEEAEEEEEARPAAPDLKILPPAVLDSFKAAYPQAVIKGASQETEKGVTYYEIESVDGKTGRDLLYTADGTAVEVEESVAPGTLPPAVLQALAEAYPGYKILKAEELLKGGQKFFELQIGVKDKKIGVTIDPSGKIIE